MIETNRPLRPEEIPEAARAYIVFKTVQTAIRQFTSHIAELTCVGCGAIRTYHVSDLRSNFAKGALLPRCNACSRVYRKGRSSPKNTHGPSWKGWKGGVYTGQDGYVRILRPDHPYAYKTGYILEHRIIMEEKLGRFLRPTENVHHINAIRNDNRSENLELWQWSQPAGRRASDKHCRTCTCVLET